MGLFDWLTGKPAAPETVLANLKAAVRRNDARVLVKLCDKHRDLIAESFDGWRKLPEGLDAEGRQVYIATVHAVASVFEQVFDDPSLMHRARGGKDGPFDRWQAVLQRVGALAEALDYDAALDALAAFQSTLDPDHRDHDMVLEFVEGFQGQLLYHSGRGEQALPLLQRALAGCEARGDQPNIIQYLDLLYDCCRWLDRGDDARSWALRLADALDAAGSSRAGRLRATLERFPEGQPDLRAVVIGDDGQTQEFSEIESPPDGVATVGFVRRRPTLMLVHHLRTKGLASTGDAEAALALFQRACQVDPGDPAVHYDCGTALLALGRFSEALEAMQATEAIEPGWYEVQTYRRLLQAHQQGLISDELMTAYGVLQNEDGDLAVQLGIAQGLVQAHPEHAWLHLLHGVLLQRAGRMADGVAAFEAGLAVVGDDAQTRSSLLGHLGTNRGGEDGRALLLEALDLPGGNFRARAWSSLILRLAAH